MKESGTTNVMLSSLQYLKTHTLAIHDRIKNDNCDFCGKSFSYKSALEKHVNSIHSNDPNKHKCDSCGKSFTQARTIRIHFKMVHEGQKNHKCDSCSKYFSTPQSLRNHIKAIHDGTKDQKCSSCGKSFTQAGYLKKHIYSKSLINKSLISTILAIRRFSRESNSLISTIFCYIKC